MLTLKHKGFNMFLANPFLKHFQVNLTLNINIFRSLVAFFNFGKNI